MAAFLFAVGADAHGSGTATQEDYIHTPLPPGFQVIVTELDGPVFADSKGHTLYKWPRKALRNGNAGELPNKPTCDRHVYRESAGLMTPYPAGLEMPEVDTRPSCTDVWPPVLASADAKPLGKWTIVDRTDGRKQWAYDSSPLYTSVLDKQAGDVLGGSTMFDNTAGAGAGALRFPIAPDPNVPSQFRVFTTMMGRLVTLKDGWSVYSYDSDRRNKSNCYGACLDQFQPILAAAYARGVGEWTTFERAPGVRQWALRGMPVYRYLNDTKAKSQDGTDIPRWRNVYTQMAPEPPSGFAPKDTTVGVVLGDSAGRTLYRYTCNDDALDQLACDYPEAPQAYRFAVCGGGDPDRCLKAFPYVLAPARAKSGSQTWSALYIDPKTGKQTTSEHAGALYVWAFRGRPVYTYAGDRKRSDLNAMAWGEFNGERNGFRAMVYRDIFSGHAD
jgi:predicted lipoprotein with Yx(FWY)xxD motif